ncbi:MAG: DNA polymerase III subunit gamma/tau [Thermodesulfobacteriota bacterium]
MSSYLVIARKWRPGLFDEIVGQAHVTRTLTGAVSSGRIAHAYLFSGPRGVGKTTAARILAKCLNCEKGPTPEPCNSCDSCRSIASGTSVDVFEIDGASNTSVDNVRELRESVRYVPAGGRYKVYIIDEVHMLSTSAFNALLKTLEEPPPHAVFIFATTEVHKIPATILSRCQRFDFKRIPTAEIYGRLKEIMEKEGIGYEEGALVSIAREADGSLRDAQSLLDQVVAYSGGEVRAADVASSLGLMDRTILTGLLAAVVGGDSGECLNIVEKIYDFGYDLKKACADLLEYIRDLTVMKVSGADPLTDLDGGELKRLADLAEGVTPERLQILFSVIAAAYGEVSRSAFPRYSFEMALLRAAHTTDLVPIGQVISRLEDLARCGGASAARRARPAGYGSSGRAASAAPPASASEAGAPYTAPPATVDDGKVKKAAPPPPTPPPEAAGDCAAGFVGFVSERDGALAGRFQAVDVAVAGGKVIIAGSAGACGTFESKVGFLEECGLEYFNGPVKIEFKHGEVRPGGGGRKRPETDPLITEAVRLFDGRIIEDRRRQNVQ